MSSAATKKSVPLPAPEPTDWGVEVLLSPFLWGMGATVAFYQAIPYFESQQEFFQRYFCAHWTMYAVTGSFVLGMAFLIQKGLGFITEYRSLKHPLLANLKFESVASATDRACEIDQATRTLPPAQRRSKLIARVRDACRYVISRDSSAGLEGHLRYLASLAESRLNISYAIVRTITAAIPILGFLGTVIGATMAIAHFSPGQLSSLTDVTTDVVVAFDTTALALTLSVILVLITLVVEKSERNILGDVEQFGIDELAPCFPAEGGKTATALANAEARAAEQLLQRTESLVTWQTNLWQSTLEDMRGRWLEAADLQQHQFTRGLQQGMSSTLENHQQQLAETRNEMIGGCRLVAQELARVVDGVRQSGSRQQQEFVTEVGRVWSQMQDQMARSQSAHAELTAQQTARAIEAIRAWHEGLERASASITEQMTELRRQGEVLGTLTANESELIRLQSTLQNNLQSLRAVEAFQESIHSLNAAVHLLTTRARPHAA